jgi:hypothetical protein
MQLELLLHLQHVCEDLVFVLWQGDVFLFGMCHHQLHLVVEVFSHFHQLCLVSLNCQAVLIVVAGLDEFKSCFEEELSFVFAVVFNYDILLHHLLLLLRCAVVNDLSVFISKNLEMTEIIHVILLLLFLLLLLFDMVQLLHEHLLQLG